VGLFIFCPPTSGFSSAYFFSVRPCLSLIWKEVVAPRQNEISKIIFGAACFLIFAGFVVWLFLPVPLQLTVQSTIPKYGPGSNIYGILWNDYFAQVDFTLKNQSNSDYEKFDAEIYTDLTFEGVKQTGGISTCAMAPAGPVLHPINQRMVGGIPVGPHEMIGGVPVGLAETDPQEYEVVGVGPNGELTFSGDTATKYRIRCDKLPANSDATFVAAVSVVNVNLKSESLGKPLRGSPRLPLWWCTLKTKFTYLGRPRSITVSECKMGRTCAPYERPGWGEDSPSAGRRVPKFRLLVLGSWSGIFFLGNFITSW